MSSKFHGRIIDMNDTNNLLESVKSQVLEFLNGDTKQAKEWFEEANLRGKDSQDLDPNGQTLELEQFVAVELRAMLDAARYLSK